MRTTSSLTVAILALVTFGQSVAFATPADSDLSIKQAIQQSKEDVQVFGLTAEEASARFAKSVSERTPSELMHYIYTNGTASEREIFAESLTANTKFHDRDTLVEALTNISLRQQMKTGSHFKMSCAAGLGIGVPLVLAGVIIGLIGVKNSKDMSASIKKEHFDKAQKITEEYEKSNGNLQSWYNSTFADYDRTYAEVVRVAAIIKASNGGCCCDETGTPYTIILAQLKQQLITLESTRAQVYQSILSQKFDYDKKIETIVTSEKLALDVASEKRKSGQNQTIIGGVSAAAGIPFLIAGLNGCRGGDGSRAANPRN